MDEIEKALRIALRREPPSSGFADQVLRKASLRSVPVAPWWRVFPVRWAVAGIVLVACMVGGVLEHAREQRIRGEHARQQVLLALRITGTKLRAVQRQVIQRQGIKSMDEGEDHP